VHERALGGEHEAPCMSDPRLKEDLHFLRTLTEALTREVDARTEAEKQADRMRLEQALRTDPALRGLMRGFLDGLQEH
jgi:hypothetical protein